ncbi:MAG TPA: NADH-quinone oxidoreductase subunit N [Thermoanaerobaculia bacterium]|jgi:NADH-quinone oxidoreductase subunit N|nr:NADH-quinone oxidoreductase subunit N [Thermoanaerobaculia bacterium]
MTLHPLLEPGWLNAILPELILCLGGMLLILVDAFMPRAKGIVAWLGLIILILTMWSETLLVGGTFFGGTYQIRGITVVFDLTFLLAATLATLFAHDYLEREGIEGGEFYALLMWGTVGMMMMAKGLDLLIIILGLEILSICIFVLVGYHRRLPVSNEASLKYFLMGAFATGFILYGTALFYGATQSTHIYAMAEFFATADANNPLLAIAFVLLMSGFAFKLALAPFHPWAPDVYQGAPTPVAGWLSVAPKAATLIALIRIFWAMTPMLEHNTWMKMVAALSILSMIVGNVVAIVQRDLKRMLAYSGIAHVGYMMIAMLTVRDDSVAAVAVYTIVYALMNIGAFGVVSMLAKNQNDPQTLDDIAGLGFRRPFYGLALTICMFSLSGLPPTGGFISKFYIFKTAIESGHLGVALVGIITSIFSVYYYLRVVYYLYMKEPVEGYTTPVAGVFATGALAISMIGILVVGLFPTPLFNMAGSAARELLQR